MPVLHSPDTPYSKERVKWEAQHSECGPPKRPYVMHEYPMMLHRAGPLPSGAPDIIDQQIAESEVEARNLKSRGFRATPLDALAYLHATETEIAELAANRVFHEQRMSAKAQAEAAVADASTGAHVPSIPDTPIAPRSHKRTKETN